MNRVTFKLNGAPVTADIAPRTHLADFLRDGMGLTGTHLGCEHGVCGACTLLIDGAPARSCIAYTAACEGVEIHTIEGLEHDPTIVRLRAAFTAEHGLQCGYCTPGMLVTARDIVHRLPNADEAAVRLELAGNLCRCTGYAGIVRAIRRVLAEGTPTVSETPRALPVLAEIGVVPRASAMPDRGTSQITQTLLIDLPICDVWAAFRDPALVASCVPGARLTRIDANRLSGEMRASLGPIETLFTGDGTMEFDDLHWRAELFGDGGDAKTGTRLSARAVVTLRERDANATEADLAINYTLRGPLAQFARTAVVREFAGEIAGITARELEARVRGMSTTPAPPRLSIGALLWRIIMRWLRPGRR